MNQATLDSMVTLAERARRHARRGAFDGLLTSANMELLASCTHRHRYTGSVVIFTRDVGHHTSGWMKNPDYERCLHLSLAPTPPLIIGARRGELDRKLQRAWVEVFFGAGKRFVWAESPKTLIGRDAGVWHYRVFCDERWTPIVPRGEVYSTELTELGWRPSSQVFEEDGRVIDSPVDPS